MLSRCLIVVVSLLLLSLHSAGGEPKTDLDRIQGSWKVTKVEVEGKPPPPEFLEKGKFLFKGNKVSIFQDDESVEEATFVLDSAKKPPTIDFTPTDGPKKGKTIFGIYRIEGETLTLCFGDERPPDFKGKGTAGLLQFQRLKPK